MTRKPLPGIIICVLAALAQPVAASPAPEEAALPVPESLRSGVRFWTEVFRDFDGDQVIFFDAYDWDRVYEIHRLPSSNGTAARERLREELRAAIKEGIIADLEILAEPETDYTALERRLYRYHAAWDFDEDPETYVLAAENVRSQRGISDAFRAGVARAARYETEFRRILREEGVPEDLVYLPHIESSYRWNARSGAGAVGMWQFMKSTGKKYLRIDEALDERLDPYKAARAAARYLQNANRRLGSWPLTITSYNQGVASMLDAQAILGTRDIDRVVHEYRGPRFKFAGRNFYVEFLAARQVAASLTADPGSLILDEPLEFELFELPAFVKASTLAASLGLATAELKEYNLGISSSALRDREWLPKGYAIRLPLDLGGRAPELFASIPEAKRPSVEPVRTYRVRSGDNLGGIARRFGVSVRQLQRLNGIRNPNHVRIGQVLRLPG